MIASIEDEIAAAKIKDKLENILSTSTPIITTLEGKEDIILYLLPLVDYKKVVALDTIVRGLYAERGIEESNPFRHLAKIITASKKELPSQATVSYKYKINIKHIYKNISDKDKVLEHLEETFFAWSRSAQNSLTKQISDNEYDLDFIQSLHEKLNKDIESHKDKIYMLIEESEKYDLVITNFEAYNRYAVLYHTLDTGKKLNSFLREGVPNILYYEEDKLRGLSRGDAAMLKTVKEYDRICDTVYFKRSTDDA